MQDAIQAELMSLRRKDGLLRPDDVVKFASDPETALHNEFTWDDSVAAHEHRLWQARKLIVRVTILPQQDETPIQAFVSLRSDRTRDGGGYRETIRVLSSKEMREELLSQAFADFKYWQDKYQAIKELIPIFRVARRVKKNAKRPKVALAARRTRS